MQLPLHVFSPDKSHLLDYLSQRRPPAHHNHACVSKFMFFPYSPFPPLSKFLSHYIANFSLLYCEPHETWDPLLFFSHHPTSSIWALWRAGTMFYLSFYPRCLAPHAMNVLQMLVEWNKFKFYILKFCCFSWSTSMQHRCETLANLDGPTYYLFPVLSWCIFNKLCCGTWFLLCYTIIMAMCLYTIIWTES